MGVVPTLEGKETNKTGKRQRCKTSQGICTGYLTDVIADTMLFKLRIELRYY